MPAAHACEVPAIANMTTAHGAERAGTTSEAAWVSAAEATEAAGVAAAEATGVAAAEATEAAGMASAHASKAAAATMTTATHAHTTAAAAVTASAAATTTTTAARERARADCGAADRESCDHHSNAMPCKFLHAFASLFEFQLGSQQRCCNSDMAPVRFRS